MVPRLVELCRRCKPGMTSRYLCRCVWYTKYQSIDAEGGIGKFDGDDEMTTLTHTAALPARPGSGISLFESARATVYALRSALAPRSQAETIFGSDGRQHRRPEVVYMRFYA